MTMNNQFPSTPVLITLADGKERRLRFNLGAVRRIKEKYLKEFPPGSESKEAQLQSPVMTAITKSPENVLPYMLMQGLVEKDGLTEEVLAEELLSGDMLDELSLTVIEAFFGQRVARNLRDALALQNKTREVMLDKAMQALTAKGEISKGDPTIQ